LFKLIVVFRNIYISFLFFRAMSKLVVWNIVLIVALVGLFFFGSSPSLSPKPSSSPSSVGAYPTGCQTPPTINGSFSTVSVIPYSQSAPANSYLIYSVNVVNILTSQNAGCPPSTFDLSYNSIPPTWTAGFSYGSVTLAPGASTTVSFLIIPDPNSLPGHNYFNVRSTRRDLPLTSPAVAHGDFQVI
jgi:hypothetical protein